MVGCCSADFLEVKKLCLNIDEAKSTSALIPHATWKSQSTEVVKATPAPNAL